MQDLDRTPPATALERTAFAVRCAMQSLLINVALAIVKVAGGLAGNSFALVADGIESLTDGLVSVIVVVGLRVSAIPPDDEHPFGHGRAENLAALLVALSLYGAAGLIAWQAVHEIRNPHQAPAWWTLLVLGGVVLVKWSFARRQDRVGAALGSSSLRADAWHHWSDAVTSAAAMVGISVALLGGPGWESADDWAALAACLLIAYNASGILRRGLDEAMDRTVDAGLEARLRAVAGAVDGVGRIEKCRVRRAGLGLLMEVHVQVHAELSVRAGHDIAGAVKRALLDSDLGVDDVVTHIEPLDGPPAPRLPTVPPEP
ncbi:MAG: cation diffusion facilitator family transporter [Candidatus Sumerlaeia bacterium]|nr:cation diffusion facilitator family transporter [Candidatus Sumerlaeia bacterium]